MLRFVKKGISSLLPSPKSSDLDAIVFVHWGEAEYRDCALDQAADANPNVKVILVSDVPYTTSKRNIINAKLNDFKQSDIDLRSCFVNYSTNADNYEYMCFARWFIIADVCRKYRLKTIFYADSDVLIYDDLQEFSDSIGAYDFTLSSGNCGHSSFWKISALSAFCGYVLKIYQEDHSRLSSWYKEFRAQGNPGGYCDMSALREFLASSDLHCYDTTKIVEARTFDHNINISRNGDYLFKMKNGAKELVWIRGFPYCKVTSNNDLIRFSTIHFQGEAKSRLPEIYRNGGQIYL